jgi:arylsulfatase A-like enzyme
MITMIDDGVAKVLKRLDELGLAKDTVVIFTSDHGDLMGDHQLMLKGAFAYEGLTRVPFIWAEPDGARAGTRTDALAGTLDIAATMLDRAKIAPYNGLQGKSVLPMMDGGDGHDAILIEYGSQRPLHGTTGEMAMRTLVDGRYRITYYRGVPWGEFYDLANDPLEMDNLWDDPAAATAKRDMTERLMHKMMELAERSPRPTRSA